MKKLIILFFCLPLFLFAQKVENDPYSRYGLGELADRSIMAYRSMGHTSIANADRFHINLANPASLAYLGTAAYEVGASAKNATLKEGENKATAWSGNLEYISLGFPLKNPINEVYETSKKNYKLGMAISLNRHSRSAYNIASIDSLDGVGIFQRSYSGSGGTYKFQWGNAIGYKSWAFGVNLGYLFGGINSTKEILFSDLENAFNNFFEKSYHIKAFTLQTGLMYNWHLNQKAAADNPSIPLRTLRFGLTIVPSSGFTTVTDELILNRQVIGTGTVVTDTITSGTDLDGDGKLPTELGFGVMWQNGEKSSIGAEVRTGNWSSYYNTTTGESKGALGNSLHVSIGGFIRPNFKSYTSFWKRAYYKYGVYYREDARIILDKQPTTYGVTFGAGLPFVFQRRLSHANIGFDIGKKGSGTVIEENFFKINFGFTFNDDEWFIKRKYN